MIAQTPIAHGDELFVDYLKEERASIDFVPDWLLEPPEPNPYLVKKEITAKVPFAIKLLYNY